MQFRISFLLAIWSAIVLAFFFVMFDSLSRSLALGAALVGAALVIVTLRRKPRGKVKSAKKRQADARLLGHGGTDHNGLP
jgi:membrane associated rhomboid family serine protease